MKMRRYNRWSRWLLNAEIKGNFERKGVKLQSQVIEVATSNVELLIESLKMGIEIAVGLILK